MLNINKPRIEYYEIAYRNVLTYLKAFLFLVTSHLSLLHLCSVSKTLLGWWMGCKRLVIFMNDSLHLLFLALRRFENNSAFTWDQKFFLAFISIRSLSQPTKTSWDEPETQNLLIQSRASTHTHMSHTLLSEDPDWLHSFSDLRLWVLLPLLK